MKALQFMTAIPWNVRRGSGCYFGTRTLAEALVRLGIRVERIMPKIITPAYATTRLLFNESMRRRHFNAGATIGIDAVLSVCRFTLASASFRDSLETKGQRELCQFRNALRPPVRP